jgi:hypothetical protein
VPITRRDKRLDKNRRRIKIQTKIRNRGRKRKYDKHEKGEV